MWVFPAVAKAPRVDVMRQHAVEPAAFDQLEEPLTEQRAKAWLQRWTKTVLK
jgi:thiamine transport system substrate-binding protein